jgi:hypothetical protein
LRALLGRDRVTILMTLTIERGNRAKAFLKCACERSSDRTFDKPRKHFE